MTNFKNNEIFWWKPKRKLKNFYIQKYNVGDLLSAYLCQKILNSKNLSLNPKRKTNQRVLAIGSIIHFARENDIIWGSGINGKIPLSEIKARKLDIRSVRGPKTAQILNDFSIHTPDIYGDPALLIYKFIPKLEKRYEISIIPHYNHMNVINETTHNIIKPNENIESFCNKISASNLIISSSLHGLIIAESYGVPAIYWDNNNGETIFKYEDYYQGTGRKTFNKGKTIAECIEIGGNVLPYFDEDKLLNAFPFDFFTTK
ncbi:polysaccharide pyruvyl transferase family protein [Thalassobellus sediminis]|uniref:polysaccharide pyruvyl transferase family protein n=1 Tax=Thalassobellus sediminis TaxID=3367753 RepID=UPI003787BDF4